MLVCPGAINILSFPTVLIFPCISIHLPPALVSHKIAPAVESNCSSYSHGAICVLVAAIPFGFGAFLSVIFNCIEI